MAIANLRAGFAVQRGCLLLSAAYGLAALGDTCPAISHPGRLCTIIGINFVAPACGPSSIEALRETERRRVGRDPHPTAAIMDAPSV